MRLWLNYGLRAIGKFRSRANHRLSLVSRFESSLPAVHCACNRLRGIL
jgi:hypothetical protein